MPPQLPQAARLHQPEQHRSPTILHRRVRSEILLLTSHLIQQKRPGKKRRAFFLPSARRSPKSSKVTERDLPCFCRPPRPTVVASAVILSAAKDPETLNYPPPSRTFSARISHRHCRLQPARIVISTGAARSFICEQRSGEIRVSPPPGHNRVHPRRSPTPP